MDLGEFGWSPRDGDDGESQLTMQRIQVEDVEPPDNGSVKEDRPHAIEGSETPDEGDHAPGPVGPVDPDVRRPYRLDMVGQGDGDRGERSDAFASLERTVVHADDARVGLSEGAP
jgi:hypothetical protein